MKYTNNHNIPEVFYKAFTRDMYDGSRTDPAFMSISDLISVPRIRQLRLRHWDDLVIDVIELEKSCEGTALHEFIEKRISDDVFWITEKRVDVDYKGYNLSGKLDLYKLDKKEIRDTKRTTVSRIKREPGGLLSWIQQLNCYAYLYNSIGLEVKNLFIDVKFSDWNQYQISVENYPQAWGITLELPIWTTEQQKAFIDERLAFHDKYDNVADSDLPLCTPEERWQTNTVYKIFKNNNKRASCVSDDKETVESIFKEQSEKNPKVNYTMKEFPGEDRRCKTCLVRVVCDYWKKNYGNEEG